MEAQQAEGAKTLRIAFVGGGSSCQEFLELTERLQNLKVQILGVADPDPQAPGAVCARRRGIFTCQDVGPLLELEGLDVLVDLTGSEEVRNTLDRLKPGQVAYVDQASARLFLQVMGAELAAREEMAATNSFHETIFNGIQDEIVIIDRDLRIVDANEAVSQGLGRPGEELVGSQCCQVCHRKNPCPENDPCPVRQALRTGLLSQAALPDIAAGGQRIVHWVMGFPMRDEAGKVSQVVRIAHDITEQSLAEEALREGERRYRALVDNAIVGVFRTSLEGEILYLNQALATMMGYERPEALTGGDIRERYVQPGRRQEFLALLRSQGQVSGFEADFRTKQGEPRTLLLSASLQGENIEGMLIDITERKRAEEKLALYKEIIAKSSEAIAIIDPQGHYFEQNAAHRSLLGYSDEELRGKTPAIHLGEEVFSAVARKQARTGAYRGELITRTKEGAPLDIDLSAFAVRDDAGEPVCYVGIKRDITERKRAEEALRESEERFRNLMDYIPGVSIQGYGTDGTVFYWNKASEEVYGWSAEEAIGKNLGDLIIPPDIKPHFEHALKLGANLTSSGEFMPPGELLLLHKDGSLVPVYSIHTAVCLEGREPLMFCIDVDLSERKRAEEALREGERRYRALVDNAIVGVFRTSLEGEILYLNQALATMMGYERPEALTGGDIRERYVQPGRRQEFLALLRSQGQVSGFEADFRTKQGEPRTLLLSASLQGENIEGMLIDITERKRAEEKLALYKQIIAKSSEAIAIIDPQGHYLEQNAAHRSLLGYSDEELRGKTPAVHLGEEVFSAVAQEQAKSGAYCGELVSRTKEGASLDIDLSAFAVRDEAGEPVCYVGIKRDITERKRAEDALRESEQKYRALYENMMDAVFVADAETGKLIDANKAGCALTGRSRQELIGQPQTILHPPQEAARYAEIFRRHVEQGAGVIEEEILVHHASGKLIPSQIAAKVIEVGGRRIIHGIFRDLTEQRQAELVRKDLSNYQQALAVIRAHLGDAEPSDEIIADFLQVMVQQFGFLMAWYGRLEDGQVRPKLSAGKVDRYLDGLVLPVSPPENPRAQCAISMALLNRKPFGYADLMHDEGFSAWRDYALELGYQSNLALPLVVDGEVRGGIMVYDKLPHAFPEERVQYLAELVGELGAVMATIAQRKHAEEALREGERFLSGIFTCIQDGLSILDDKLNIVRVNPAMEQWYAHSLPLVGKKCYQAYHEREERCESCPSCHTLETGEPSYEVVVKRAQGGEGVGWLDVYTFPFVDQATGQVKGVIEYVRDITERYRAESRLLEETRLTEGIVDGCPVAMFVIDRNHRLVYWNRACEQLTGLRREEMLSTNRQWEPWYHEKRPVMADLVMDGNVKELERLYRHQGLAAVPYVQDAYKGEGYFDRLGRHLYFLAAPVYDEQGQVLGAIETVQDVTETKALERRLQEYSRELEETIGELERKTRKLEAQETSQRAYTELLTLLNSIDINQILRSSLRRIVTQANCQLGLIYLREGPEEELRLMASYSVDADALDAPMLQPAGGLPAKVVQEVRRIVIQDVPEDARFSFNLGFARTTPRTVVGLPITFREQVLGAFIVASLENMDAERLSFLDNCLRQVAVAINNALAFAQIERQSQELADINRELAEASRLKSEFVANMSHELRTPLNSILGFSDILLKNKEGNLSERQLGNVEKIRRNGAGLLALINSILDLSRVEAGKLEVAEEPTNIRQVVEECVDSVRPLAEKNALELVLEPIDELPIIRSDGAKVGQVLVNLLSNAIKFTEEGRVSVRVRKRRRREDPIEIAVEDTGIGIASQDLEEVFKEFKQLDGAASRRYGGTGLGLSISKRLAELLGGEILVESEVGRGSSFTLRLPVRRHEVALTPPARTRPAAGLGPAREGPRSGYKLVLIIGADADSTHLVEQQAEALGCEVRVCGSGQEGPKRAAELAPDVVVLDLSMPDRNGWEVLGELKGKEATRDLTVMVISGHHDRKRAYYLGATEFVPRPLEADRLRSALARVLRPSRGRILVVDDEPEYLEAIREWLGDAVGEVCPARNGVEALRQLETRRPDAIFLDLMMPQMDGFEFLKQVRSLEGCSELPVVVVTGKQLGSDELARIQDGATSVIQKGATAQAQVMQQLERIVSRLS